MATVRAAITQVAWTGERESMVARHEELAREAAAGGVRVIGFQELFSGPYVGAVQDQRYYRGAEPIPGPTVERFQRLAEQLGLVMILPIHEVAAQGEYYNAAAVVDADGSLLGRYRKHHIPQLPSFWEKFYFRPGNLGYPVFDTAVGRIGVYICYDRHFPEGWRELGLGGAQLVFNPSAAKPGLSNRLWEIEQPAAAAANQYFVAANNRIGQEAGEFGADAPRFYGSSYFVDPRGVVVGEVASADKEELVVRDLDLGEITRARDDWQFYRDRRPETYQRAVRE
ncbi:nitrilase-related carbon-nitrogen hydrolase [Parafrankia elaeagni]|uniref:nitrilase-related carbon-nitrogen hydrolase n=1 Tax=Parafrankia elaeagni TaxID=222534 RepID=UPI00036871BB|nr:nitrilase-related carbon-nitrogen hydrolase [Parafrankia elaeagni]